MAELDAHAGVLHWPRYANQTRDPATWATSCGLGGADGEVAFTERPAAVTCRICNGEDPQPRVEAETAAAALAQVRSALALIVRTLDALDG